MYDFTEMSSQTADGTSDESKKKCDSTSETTPIIIGVIIAAVGVVVGTVGISIAVYVVVKKRYVEPDRLICYTLIELLRLYYIHIVCHTNRAVSDSKVMGVATEDNPAYGVSGPHGKGDQTEQVYEMPNFIQPPPASHEAVYEGIN